MHNGRFKRYTGSYKEGLNNWRHPIIIELTYIVKKIQTYVQWNIGEYFDIHVTSLFSLISTIFYQISWG